tara:strand:- start:464 stop:718 length:255 start_codon:yes stop_codon:yes gene_type:complete
MKIFLLFSLIIIAMSVIVRNLFSTAKRNLFKDQAAWSGKDIKITYKTKRESTESSGKGNYLKIIADESKNFLEDTPNKENDAIK